MSRSFHTDKPEIIAKRNIENNRNKRPLRIQEKKLKNNDIHPLPKSIILKSLETVPVEYYYGLKGIELIQRQKPVGKPFATYSLNDKVIRLFSLPITWNLDSLSPYFEHELKKYNPEIIRLESGEVIINWNDKNSLMMWYHFHVFYHELGHHFCNQYKQKRKAGSNFHEEVIADLQSNRLTKNFFKTILKIK